jgi:DNA-binding transcriptional LysR family regulator
VAGVSGIDLNLLVALGALLEERNLTRAGAKVNLSQPTMSGALARLRRHFGDELLVRSGRQYLLTPVAQRLLPAVHEALGQVERTFAATGEFDPATSGREFSVAIAGQSIVMLSGLLRLVHNLAPAVLLQLRVIPAELIKGDRGMLEHDLLIAPMEYYQPEGEPEVISRDRFVCVADRANPALRGGQLSLAGLQALPQAVAQLPHSEADPLRAAQEAHGVKPNVVLTTSGWLPLPFLVSGTDMVAAVPERLARRVSKAAGVTVIEPPFGRVELVEAAWWHPMRGADPALSWLRSVLARPAPA